MFGNKTKPKPLQLCEVARLEHSATLVEGTYQIYQKFASSQSGSADGLLHRLDFAELFFSALAQRLTLHNRSLIRVLVQQLQACRAFLLHGQAYQTKKVHKWRDVRGISGTVEMNERSRL